MFLWFFQLNSNKTLNRNLPLYPIFSIRSPGGTAPTPFREYPFMVYFLHQMPTRWLQWCLQCCQYRSRPRVCVRFANSIKFACKVDCTARNSWPAGWWRSLRLKYSEMVCLELSVITSRRGRLRTWNRCCCCCILFCINCKWIIDKYVNDGCF